MCSDDLRICGGPALSKDRGKLPSHLCSCSWVFGQCLALLPLESAGLECEPAHRTSAWLCFGNGLAEPAFLVQLRLAIDRNTSGSKQAGGRLPGPINVACGCAGAMLTAKQHNFREALVSEAA